MNELINDALLDYTNAADPILNAQRLFGKKYLPFFEKTPDNRLKVKDTDIVLEYAFRTKHFIWRYYDNGHRVLDVIDLSSLGKVIDIRYPK